MLLNLLLLLLGLAEPAQAPSPSQPAAQASATYLSSSELMNVLATKAKATPAPEMMTAPVKSADRIGINVVRRTKPQGAIAHDVGTEIHSIIDGSATLVTDGTIVRPANGGRGGGTIQAGTSRRVSAGDIVVVPPQTPHWYQDIDGTVTYLEIRFDVGAPPKGPTVFQKHTDLWSVLTGKGQAANAPLMFDAPVTSGPKYQANVVRRTKAQGTAAHELGTEVHHILEGSGTFVSGGTIVRPASGSGGVATIDGGVSRHVAKGDVVVIPAGMPHWYKEVDGSSITYLEVRFEVGK
jgi:quercetin dioxygenase-like cupin family protein